MGTKVTINSITAGHGAAGDINSNDTILADAFDNTLSRDGTSPNQMEADIDLNSNDLLNVKDIGVTNVNATNININGVPVTTTGVTSLPWLSSTADGVAMVIDATENVTFNQDVTVSGNFTSLGIDDNATSTAITIDATENTTFSGDILVPNDTIGVGESTPSRQVVVRGSTLSLAGSAGLLVANAANAGVLIGSDNVIGAVQGVNSAGAAVLQLSIQPYGGNIRVGDYNSAATKLDVLGDIRASTGILFNADTAAANTLDDYEEGTWTPSLNGNTTYTTQLGVYTKVGNRIDIHCSLEVNTLGTGSSNSITGLPFTMGAVAASFPVSFFTGLAVSPVFLNYHFAASGTGITTYGLTAAASAASVQSIFGNGARIHFSGTYYT